jgi:mono/diheme cytochrome c family protein
MSYLVHGDRHPPGSLWPIPALLVLCLLACKAKPPSTAEEKIAGEAKKVTIGGKDWKNPIPENDENVKAGATHFQHHCQICHGLDGQNTGVPFADKMNPPVANLAMNDIQSYADGQLKWIIQNGIRYSGILSDEEMWHVVLYLRHLPAKGSMGTPAVFKESEAEHTGEHTGKSPGPTHTQ